MSSEILLPGKATSHQNGWGLYPILINILPASPKLEIAKRYESEFVGLKARQDYRIINLWEVDANLVFQQPLPTLLPFVPILKGGNQELLVRQALRQLQADQQLSELEPLLAFFASFVLETPLVQQIMRWGKPLPFWDLGFCTEKRHEFQNGRGL